MRRIFRFLKEARSELAKVVWPTRAKTFRLTIAVIVVTALFGVFIGVVDLGLNKGIQYVIDNAGKTNTKSGKTNGGGTTQTVPAGQGDQPVQIPAGSIPAGSIPGGAAPAQPNQ